MSDEETLRRLTELRLRSVREKMEHQRWIQQSQQQQQRFPPLGNMPFFQPPPIAPQFQPTFFLPPIAPAQNAVLQSKKKHLMELEHANRRLREELSASQATRASPSPRENALLRAVEKLTEQSHSQQKRESDQRLESLQMQSMLMAQMQNQPHNMMMHQAGPNPQLASPVHGQPDPHWQQPAWHDDTMLPDADDDLLRRMQDINQKLDKADLEAHQVAENAVNAANDRDERIKAEQRQQQHAAGHVEGEEEEEEEEEEEPVVEDGDEMLQEELDAYRDVAASWLKKAVKLVVLNVLLERKVTMEVQRPFVGGIFKRGLTQTEVQERLLKLGVRCKGMTRCIKDSLNPKEVPEALLTFLKRMVAHKQKYPPNFLLTSEKRALEIPLHSDRAGQIREDQAWLILTHFLFSKILVVDLISAPWLHGIGPQAPPGKYEQGNLRLIAGLMYRAACGAVAVTPRPEEAADVEVLDAIGRLPGDENYLYEESKELQGILVRDIREIIATIYLMCFPQGKTLLDPALLPVYEEDRREELVDDDNAAHNNNKNNNHNNSNVDATPRSTLSKPPAEVSPRRAGTAHGPLTARLKTGKSHVSRTESVSVKAEGGAAPGTLNRQPSQLNRQPSASNLKSQQPEALQRTDSFKSMKSVRLDPASETSKLAGADGTGEKAAGGQVKGQPAALAAIKE